MLFPLLESKDNLRTPKLGIFDSTEEAQHLFAFLKSANSLDTLWSRVITLQSEGFMDYRLVPVSSIHKENTELILNFMKLRNDNINLFIGSSEATLDSTSNWLRKDVLENKNRILFIVLDKHHKIHGHLGIWIRENNNFEIDNVIKSKESNINGLFSCALETICKWVNEYTGVSKISLRVLDTNSHAINFYKKNKFTEVGRQELSQKLINTVIPKEQWVVMSLNIEDYYSVPELILTAGPSIGPFETSLVSDAVRTGWNHHNSDYLNMFPEIFSDYVGAKFAIPTDSCTSALHLAMWALGIGPGDEVIVPEVTWVATANAVRYVGATPVFADIDPLTWTIDPVSVESLINEKTKAIIPVHLYGYVADLGPLEALCSKFNLKLVQDAAPGIGSTYNSKGVAMKGDFTCFSFQGAKLLVTGEGGVITTNDEELYQKAFKIGDSGRKPGTFWIEVLGKKMKMSNVTAAMGVAQMQSAERQIAKKRTIRDWYIEEFSGVSHVRMQEELQGTRSICWLSSLYFDEPDFNRDYLRSTLLAKGIDTRPVFSPISQYPIWNKKYDPQTNARRIGDNAINLPSGVGLSRASVAKIGKEIREYLS